MNYRDLRDEAFEANVALPKLGLVKFTFGNVSAADSYKAVFAIKPSGVAYELLRPEDMVVVGFDGRVAEGKLRPSSDTPTHAVLYQHLDGIRGICHTHSTYATAWAQARLAIPVLGTTHADYAAVPVPCTRQMSDQLIGGDYELATGRQIINCLTMKKLNHRQVEMILVGGHAPFTWGLSAEKAVHHSAVLENIAEMAWLTRALNPNISPLKPALINRHHARKHGANAYYGQEKKISLMKIDLQHYELWLLTGSQHLYGEETLQKVAEHSRAIVAGMNQSNALPVKLLFKPVLTTPEEIYAICREAGNNDQCIGVVCWMHTFSPAKMWIRGLQILAKPILHLHTQYNRDIPWNSIDMDFMNLNQSAHGDREFGFIGARLRKARKIVCGHWQEAEVLRQIAAWSRAEAAWQDWQGAKFVRFGDNMRQVAVTEGDKVEAEMRFGYSVNSHAVGDLVAAMNSVTDGDVAQFVATYRAEYDFGFGTNADGAEKAIDDAAKIELGLRRFLQAGGYKGFTDTFEDLHGLNQLPGIAVQRLMADGYGFAAEGDWKTAALVRACKVMGAGLAGGNGFMEDYTYHFEPGNELVLGSHMLEIDASLAKDKPRLEIHPLGIGGKADPVRLVFNVAGGKGLNASMIDMGNRFRLIVNAVEAVEPQHDLPKLPVARVLWKPLPDMRTGCAAWLQAGGAHHTCYSQNLSIAHLRDFAEIAGIECVHIGDGTDLTALQNELRWNDLYYKLA